MSKAVMISIQPKWCELIARGTKTVEVRKTRPKLEPPFKCYIYCTANKKGLHDELEIPSLNGSVYIANGKVIGEFVCDSISEYEAEFCEGNNLYESVQKVLYDEDGYEYRTIEIANDNDNPDDCELLRNAAMSFQQLKGYAQLDGFGKLYGLHISDLVIYDHPKELNEFSKPCICTGEYEGETYCNCFDCDLAGDSDYGIIPCDRKLSRPPQSWCYVEEREENENKSND